MSVNFGPMIRLSPKSATDHHPIAWDAKDDDKLTKPSHNDILLHSSPTDPSSSLSPVPDINPLAEEKEAPLEIPQREEEEEDDEDEQAAPPPATASVSAATPASALPAQVPSNTTNRTTASTASSLGESSRVVLPPEGSQASTPLSEPPGDDEDEEEQEGQEQEEEEGSSGANQSREQQPQNPDTATVDGSVDPESASSTMSGVVNDAKTEGSRDESSGTAFKSPPHPHPQPPQSQPPHTHNSDINKIPTSSVSLPNTTNSDTNQQFHHQQLSTTSPAPPTFNSHTHSFSNDPLAMSMTSTMTTTATPNPTSSNLSSNRNAFVTPNIPTHQSTPTSQQDPKVASILELNVELFK